MKSIQVTAYGDPADVVRIVDVPARDFAWP